MVRSASEVEQNIVSVERILFYIRLPSEAADEIPENKPAEEWPSEGRVEFRLVPSSSATITPDNLPVIILCDIVQSSILF